LLHVTPEDACVWGGYYENASMIWRDRWTTRSGIIECRDALVYPAEPHHAILLRQIRAVDRSAAVSVTLQPRGGYDQTPVSEVHRHAGIWTARAGHLHLRWSGAAAARTRLAGEQLVLSLTLDASRQHDLVLEISDQPLPEQPADAGQGWRATEKAWGNDVPSLDAGSAQRDTRRSYAVLRRLTSTRGGMVAAATTSLPERAEAGRNYDYSYVWIRDLCYASIAVAAAGAYPLLDDAVSFVAARQLEHGDRMAPAYTTTGGPVPDQRQLGLPGYPGGFDLIGNWVNRQFQLDAYGEALQLFAAAARADRLDTEHWTAAETAATAIAHRWTEPDAGIWEIEPRAWTHSRLTAAGGLRAIAAAHPTPGQAADWIALADTITADTSAHALHPDGHWQRSPDDPALDAALLLPGLRGAIPPNDPRTTATLHAYLRDLTVDGYAYRFRHDERPLADAEGSFLLCGFLTALALHQHGGRLKHGAGTNAPAPPAARPSYSARNTTPPDARQPPPSLRARPHDRNLYPTRHLTQTERTPGMDALPIPKPQVLDPHRRLVNDEDHFTANHEARAALLQRALETSCAYADQLWDDLNAMRQYLLDCLPPDPHTSTGPVATGAAPTGPDDEQGWQNWMTAFAEVTSVLCGPHGDSGFGLSRARQEAQRRRTFPPGAATTADDLSAEPAKQADAPTPTPQPRAARESTIPSPQDTTPRSQPRDRLARTAGMAVLIGLALRGLHPRHSRQGTLKRPAYAP
jgi:hypothetical protein